MKSSISSVCMVAVATFVAAFSQSGAFAQVVDPMSVVKSLFHARNAGDVEAGLALFADDAVISNIAGTRMAGRESVRKFLQGGSGRYELKAIRADGEKVTWEDEVTNDVYTRLGVAPVTIRGEAQLEGGKIKIFTTHVASASLAKFERVCDNPGAEGVLVVGRPCRTFLKDATAQAERVGRR
jgi:hypothetical protein